MSTALCWTYVNWGHVPFVDIWRDMAGDTAHYVCRCWNFRQQGSNLYVSFPMRELMTASANPTLAFLALLWPSVHHLCDFWILEKVHCSCQNWISWVAKNCRFVHRVSHVSVFGYRWGYLCRTGLHDKSALTRQIEKWADIYTSRVSNFKRYTPYMYFRSLSQSLAHDRRIIEPLEYSELFEQTWGQNGTGDNGGAPSI